MSNQNFESLVKALASICPLGGLADSLQVRFSRLLSSSQLYLSPFLYSRFSVSLVFYPAIAEVLALLLPRPQSLIIIASLALVQTIPLLVPAISISSISFLSSFNQGRVPFLPSFTAVSESYILLSISTVSLLTGVLLSKLFTQTTRHAIAVPLLLASTIVSLLIFGIV